MDELEREELANGIRLHLPPRAHRSKLLPVFLAIMTGFAWLFFGLLFIPVMLASIWLLFARGEVDVLPDEIISRARLWGLQHARRRRTHGLSRLLVSDRLAARVAPVMQDYAFLVADFDGAKRFIITFWRDPSRLHQLALAIAAHLGLPPNVVTWEGPSAPMLPLVPEDLVRPTHSRATLDRSGQRITLTLPPKGFVVSYQLLFLASLLFFVGVPCVVYAYGKLPAAGCGAFVLFGALLCAHSIATPRKRAVFTIDRGDLHIVETRPFSTHVHELPKGDVSRIQAVDNGSTHEGRYHANWQLQIVATGQRLQLGSGRSRQELHWVASVLRSELGI